MLICFLLSFCFLGQSGYCKEKDIEKRLLLNDPETILAELKTMNVKLNELNIKVASLETDNTNLKHQISKEIKGGKFLFLTAKYVLFRQRHPLQIRITTKLPNTYPIQNQFKSKLNLAK